MRERHLKFKVEILAGPDITAEDAQAYVESALASYCGGLSPEDPLWDIRDKITVVPGRQMWPSKRAGKKK